MSTRTLARHDLGRAVTNRALERSLSRRIPAWADALLARCQKRSATATARDVIVLARVVGPRRLSRVLTTAFTLQTLKRFVAHRALERPLSENPA